MLRRVLIIYVIYVALAAAFQRCIVFPEWKHAEPDVDGAAFGYVQLDIGDVEAWFLPSGADEPSPVVIFGHGNAELVSDWFEALTPYTDMGIGVLLVEYPGYGGAEGDPSEASIELALDSAYDAVVQRPDVDPERIVAHGRSIGGGAVCRLIDDRPIAAVILESTFAELSRFAWRYLLPSIIVRDDFDNVSVIREYAGPVLVLHGNEDSLVPIENGRELADTAADGQFVELDCGHNDCVRDQDSYWSVIGEFLQQADVASVQSTLQ